MRKTLWILACTLVFGSVAMADSACPNGVTLASYASISGGSCFIGNVDFSNFFFNNNSSGGAPLIPASAITVNTTNDPVLGPGFAFTVSGMSVTSPGSQDIDVGFTATGINGYSIDDLGIGFNGSFTGSGTTAFTESWCFKNEAPTTCVSTPNGDFAVTNPPPNLSNEVTFASPVAAVTVLKDVSVATGTAAGTAHISAFGNTFSEVPEPMYTSFLALGLLGLGWLRKRRQSQD